MSSCLGHRSLEEFQEEGEGVVRSLIQELSHLYSREDIMAAYSRLEVCFERLVSLIIAAEEFQENNELKDKCISLVPISDLSEQLRIELNRIYQIDGGQQLIEKIQENALHRLDTFEQRHMKNRPCSSKKVIQK